MTLGAMCAVHPDQEAVGTCERCGLFGCVGCLGVTSGERLCPSCVRRRVAELPALESRASVARSGLFMMGAVHLGLAVVPTGLAGSMSAGLGGFLGVLFFPLFMGTIVAFLKWFHLATKYALALGRPVAETPGSAVLSWFIPVLNLFKPFNLARKMNGAAPVGAWQVCWLGGNVTSSVGGQSGFLGPVSGALMVSAALLGAEVVKQISASLTAPSDD